MHEKAFGCAREEFWVAEAEGIRMPKDGIRMPKRAFGYYKEAAARRVSGCWEAHPNES